MQRICAQQGHKMPNVPEKKRRKKKTRKEKQITCAVKRANDLTERSVHMKPNESIFDGVERWHHSLHFFLPPSASEVSVFKVTQLNSGTFEHSKYGYTFVPLQHHLILPLVSNDLLQKSLFAGVIIAILACAMKNMTQICVIGFGNGEKKRYRCNASTHARLAYLSGGGLNKMLHISLHFFNYNTNMQHALERAKKKCRIYAKTLLKRALHTK